MQEKEGSVAKKKEKQIAKYARKEEKRGEICKKKIKNVAKYCIRSTVEEGNFELEG
jgi:hypothetical protein